MPAVGIGEIAEKLRRSTVLIHAGGLSCGSGVIWASDGLIVTNAHVARRPDVRAELWDGRSIPAQVARRSPRHDLAALRIAASGLPAVSAGDSLQLRPGEIAIAIGNPFGFMGALTIGVIHGVGPMRGLGPQSWVQAAVRLAPGNSGGPLADARGRVIGINTMVVGTLALAVPSNTVERFLESEPESAWLGVTLCPVHFPQSGGRAFGLLVTEVVPGSPAANASLMPGDILIGAEDRKFESLDDLHAAVEGSAARLLRLEFLRGNYTRTRRVTVQLGERNAVAA